jgi:hypothetical protein
MCIEKETSAKTGESLVKTQGVEFPQEQTLQADDSMTMTAV